MRSEEEVRENLEWLKSQCRHYRTNEKERVTLQLEIMLWVLGSERTAARTEAALIWQEGRDERQQNPRDY